MRKPALGTWKYRHDYPNQFPFRARTFLGFLAVILAGWSLGVLLFKSGLASKDMVVTGWIWLGGITGLVLLVHLIRNFPKRQITIGPRYLVCGTLVVYFANVTSVTIARRQGRLTLTTASGSGHGFTLEQTRFPTNARKPHKIAANTAGKFNKVASRIVDRVRRASPEAVITDYSG